MVNLQKKYKYYYCWNPELKYRYDNRYKIDQHTKLFFHICNYRKKEEILEFYKNDWKLLETFIKGKKQILNKDKIQYYKKNENILKIANLILKMWWEKPIETYNEFYEQNLLAQKIKITEWLLRFTKKELKDIITTINNIKLQNKRNTKEIPIAAIKRKRKETFKNYIYYYFKLPILKIKKLFINIL